MKCEVINISTTPSWYILQGDCSRCHEHIFYFSDALTGTPDTGAEHSRGKSARSNKTPAHARRPARAKASLREQGRIVWPARKTINLRLFSAIASVLLLTALVVFIVWLVSPAVPVTVISSPTVISITNISDTDWQHVSLLLNDTYSYTLQLAAKPLTIRAHETRSLVYSYFTTKDGEMFNPAIPCKRLRIEANGGSNHPLQTTVGIQRIGVR